MANISHENSKISEAARVLGHAADNGELETVRDLVSRHPGILNARGGILGSTALHFAAASGHNNVARLLIDAGADVNAREYASDTLPIHWASKHGHLEIVKLLVEHGAAVDLADGWYGLTSVGWASALPASPQSAVADYLVAHGASFDVFSIISLEQDGELGKLLAASQEALSSRIGRIGERYGPLHWAVQKGNRSAVQALIDAGADVNQKSGWGISALALAAERDDATLRVDLLSRGSATDLSALIMSGAYQDAVNTLQDRREIVRSGGECELMVHWLTQRNDACGLKAVLAAGADPDAESHMIIDELLCSSTALHRAAARGHVEIVRILLEHNADPNQRCKQLGLMPYWDVTPLHAAAWRGQVEVAKILIEHGSDTKLRDNHGVGTPSDWARSFWGDNMAAHFQSP